MVRSIIVQTDILYTAVLETRTTKKISKKVQYLSYLSRYYCIENKTQLPIVYLYTGITITSIHQIFLVNKKNGKTGYCSHSAKSPLCWDAFFHIHFEAITMVRPVQVCKKSVLEEDKC